MNIGLDDPLRDPAALFALLARWVERGWLREIDRALAHFLAEQCPDADPALLLAAALVSHQLGRGHVCLDLAATLADPFMALSLPPEQEGLPAAEPLPLPGELLAGWTLADWTARLAHPDLVGDGSAGERTPLVLAGRRLYLRRYWRQERAVEAAIAARLSRREEIAATLPANFRTTLDALFPPAPVPDGGPDWQKLAGALAAGSAFAIVTGGPGTGKTTTVVRLLALLQALALENGEALAIRLAAPTGKAAARLKEAIVGAIGQLPAFVHANAALAAAIPAEVTTLHRLLGSRPDSRQFRHDAQNPLPLDVLVVDEASMIDLETMAATLAALPANARLILLGDQDQLASVEAGSVLGELCARARAGHYTPATADWLLTLSGEKIPTELLANEAPAAALPPSPSHLAGEGRGEGGVEAGRPLDQHIVLLRHSRRFAAGSGIGRLAAAVNAGDPAAIRAVWANGHADLTRLDLATLDDARLNALLLGNADAPGYAAYLELIAAARPTPGADRAAIDRWAGEVLAAHGRFQLLCALRNSPCGVAGINARVEALLARRGLIVPDGQWYEGRPVLVTRNDYRLGLMNGDIGIALRRPADAAAGGEAALRVAFPRDGGIHWLLPSRLQAVETVYALTVHKSQGSEFEHCALLLPPGRNPVLTRELVYTGITRAKRRFSLITLGAPGGIEDAAERTVQRSGGLFAPED